MTHGELFAGISGFGLGFQRAGIALRWAVEIDKNCQGVIGRHHPGIPILSDVCEVGAHNLEPVNVITFGSPCQDLSVAGKRKGLNGERSGLFFEAIRIVDELKPTLAVWENVPGALSSNSGRDFAAVLSAFRECGARDVAWRVLDAQYFGVAQRRRRVFVVADFGGERTAQVLFEPESCGGDSAPSREAGARVAALTSCGVGTCGADDNQAQAGHLVARPLTAPRNGQRYCAEDDTFVTSTLTGNGDGHTGFRDADGLVTHTLRAEGCDASEDGTGRRTPIVAEQQAVRRLTPVECERLQGFPDGWTDGQADSTRYRQLGNAVCVNVAEWIGRRLLNASQG